MKIADCDFVILCGGLGTRLRDAIGEIPKVMAPVGGRPFLDLIIEYLKNEGARRIVLCTGYRAEMVEDHYRAHDFGMTIDFSREDRPLGTGGALAHAREILTGNPFFVLNGDSFLPVDLKAFLDFHRSKNGLATVIVSQVAKTSDFGSLELDSSGKVLKFMEKTDGVGKRLVNAGMYCFNREIFKHMPESGTFSLEYDVFPALIGKAFYGYCVDQEFIDIGTPERYEKLKKDLSKGKKGEN